MVLERELLEAGSWMRGSTEAPHRTPEAILLHGLSPLRTIRNDSCVSPMVRFHLQPSMGRGEASPRPWGLLQRVWSRQEAVAEPPGGAPEPPHKARWSF